MLRYLLILVAVTSSASADPAACETASADLAKLRATNEAAFSKALANKKLSPIKPAMRFRPNAGPPRKAGTIFSDGPKGKTARYLALESYPGCHERTYELVIDRAKRVFVVTRAPREVGKASISSCGCAPYDQGCGANPGLAQMQAELPPGASYGGKVSIPYDATTIFENFTGTYPNGTACPAEQFVP